MAVHELTLRAMDQDETAEFLRASQDGYVQQRIASGEPPDVARRISREQHDQLFPEGRPAPGNDLFVALDSGTRIGVLWLGPMMGSDDATRLWIFDIEVDEAVRGRGYGRALLAAAERRAAERGATELGLNVFGQNTVARSLYRSAGFAERSVYMSKPLTS